MSKHIAGKFELHVSNKKAVLLYEDKEILEGCDKIIDLLLNIGIGSPTIIDKLNISEEETIYLELMLKKAVYSNNICINK